ncbi:hypothetical protein M422DRAFT_275892 [Sphaerobolus stellatus SS14]|uniref:NACHT domain-containing protein n=1 Tax=Sphaerobolus stellatus (strain SS14) TaxID=990650 RepID=A0A0C9UDL1_SPHS4|nr:hypothetical protein M422DRAFT_275892 [Sphaerobolus stellatus SS14]
MDIFGTISSAIDLSDMVITYVQTVKGGKEDRARLTGELIALKTLLPILQGRLQQFNVASSSEFKGAAEYTDTLLIPLSDCTAALQEMTVQLLKAESKLMWPFTKKDIDGKLQTVERCKSYITLVIQNGTFAAIEKIQEDLKSTGNDLDMVGTKMQFLLKLNIDGAAETQQMKQQIGQVEMSVKDAQLEDLADWVSPLSFEKSQDKLFETRTQNTGTWIFKTSQMEQWFQGRFGILWGKGDPGVGKTIITSVIIDRLKELYYEPSNKVAVLYIYFNYKVQYTTRELMEGLLRELILGRFLNEFTIQSLKEAMSRRDRLSNDKVVGLLKSILQLLRRTFIIVDAFDEISDEAARATLWTTLSKLTSNTSVQLLIISRPHVTGILADAELVISAQEDDVKAYIKSRIVEHEQLRRLVMNKKPSIEEEVVGRVCEESSGMFLLTRLHMDSLSGKLKRSHILSALQTLPRDFVGTYDEAMERINQQSPERKQLTLHILSWMVLAYRPLSESELLYALELSEGKEDVVLEDCYDREDILSVCAGLVVISEESSKAMLVHYTTQEYLQSRIGNISLLSEASLARACLIFGYSAFFVPKEDAMERSFADSFGEYACTGWYIHAKRTEDPGIVELCCHLLYEPQKRSILVKHMELYREITEPAWLHEELSALQICARLGLVAVADLLLDGNFKLETDADRNDYDGHIPWWIAARSQQLEIMEVIHNKKKIDVDSRDSHGRTALSYAATNGNMGIIDFLVSTVKANVNTPDRDGRIPLFYAVIRGHKSVIAYLIAAGSNVNHRDHRCAAPLHCTSGLQPHNEAVIALLLECHDIDVDPKDEDLMTPLMNAVRYNHIGAVKRLLETGAVDINASNKHGRTPFSQAMDCLTDEVARLLLAAGEVDINGTDADGRTPLSYAVGNRWQLEPGIACVQLLLQKENVDVDAADNRCRTPLSYAAETDNVEAVKMLLETERVQLDTEDITQASPFSYAARKGSWNIVKLLLDAGQAIIDKPDIEGRTPLSYAVGRNGNSKTVRLIIKTGRVDVNAVDLNLGTPLLYAAKEGDCDTVRLLIDTGNVDVNAKDVKLRTPLSYAAEEGRVDVVKVLLGTTATVDVNARDNRDRKATEWAHWHWDRDARAQIIALIEDYSNKQRL